MKYYILSNEQIENLLALAIRGNVDRNFNWITRKEKIVNFFKDKQPVELVSSGKAEYFQEHTIQTMCKGKIVNIYIQEVKND
jgi:hypothetical protein